MVALVTGSAGLLGRYACQQLKADGYDVIGVGRPAVEIPSDRFDAVLDDSTPDLVIHCAGPASVSNSVTEPLRDFEGAVGVVAALFGGLLRLPRRPRVILVSSAAVYGQPTNLPTTEDAPLQPISPYGFHRVVCELLVKEFYEVYGVPGLALRVFSAYGEGLRRQIFWDICTKALRDGEVHLQGSGRESRDFIHARDVAAAISTVAHTAPFEGEAYNVGSGVETPIRELAALLIATLGVSGPVSFSGTPRGGDPSNWCADVGRIEALGFRPSITLGEGVRGYAAWAREEFDAR